MQDFQRFCEDFFKRYFEFNPTEAIQYGVEGHDHELHDFSDLAYTVEKAFWKKSFEAIVKVPKRGLTRDERVDYELLKGKIIIENYEFAHKDYRIEDPNACLPLNDIYYPVILPNRDPEGNVVSRLKKTPGMLMDCVMNFLYHRGVNPPRLWVEVAMKSIDAGMLFLDALPQMLDAKVSVREPKELADAVADAKKALEHFGRILKYKVLPQARESYAVGEEHFNLLLRHKHFLSMNARELLSFGEKLFTETKKELLRVTDTITPGKSVEAVAFKIQERHPDANGILNAYRKATSAAREFVFQKKLVSFPPKEELRVVETPIFMRHEIPFAAYQSPPPTDFEQIGYYYVTPPVSEDELREHNWRGIESTSVHEGFPGHHFQLTLANFYPAAHTLPRLMNDSSVMFEGWALYCEQMMHDEGFLSKPEHEFIMLKDRLWRTLRIIIDVSTQCYGMTYEEAAELMVRELAFPRSQAEADLNWYSQSPATPMGYALGWHMITALRKGEEERLGKRFSLRKFHDRFLQAGSIAPPLIIKRYFRK